MDGNTLLDILEY